jgi:hypothetical protein
MEGRIVVRWYGVQAVTPAATPIVGNGLHGHLSNVSLLDEYDTLVLRGGYG